MKTDPTTSISGAAGIPLAYETVQSGRNAVTHSDPNTKPKEAISDTVETTDREGDGRQILDMPVGSGHAETDSSDEQNRLDLTG